MNTQLIDWATLIYNLVHLAVAFLLALPVAWDREKNARGVGLRTFTLVSIASCGYVLMTQKVFGNSSEAQARILQGLMTGIGFIGGGAILKHGADVRGIATAASIWNTGAVGAAVAFARYEIAIMLSLINFVTLRLLTPSEQDKTSGEKREDNDEQP